MAGALTIPVAAKKLGIHQQTVFRILAGGTVTRGTVALIERALAAEGGTT